MRIIRLLVISVFSASSASYAVGLRDVFDEALHKNESVPTQYEAVVQAQETVKQAWGSMVPNISGSSQWMWEQSVPGAAGSFTPDWNPYIKLTATQPMFQGFREWFGLDQARKQREQQERTLDNTELTLFKTVSAAYYNILYLERDIKNLVDMIGYLSSEIRQYEQWRKIGRAQLTDVLTAQATAAQGQVAIEQDVELLKVARDNFALTTGLPADTNLDDDTVNFRPMLEPLESYIDQIKIRPDVKSNQEALIAAQDNINVQKANYIPSLAFTADKYFLRAGVSNDVGWDAGLVLTVPIFDGLVNLSKIRQAYSQSHQAELSLSLTQRSAYEEIRQYYDSVKSDLKQLLLNKKNVSINEANFKEEERSFRLGLVNNLNVLTALTGYITAKRTYDQNRFNLKADYLHLKAAVSANKATLL